MSNVSEWSVTAGSNNNSPPNGWPEGMARSAVNDTAREMMAALAKWYQDQNGTLVSAGGTTAYTLATNSVYTALSDIPVLVFRVNAANTGAVTLNVDGLGAKPWRRYANLADYASGELALNQLCVVAYNSAEDDFFTVGPMSDSGVPVGTAMVFYQAAVPTGWTAVAQNDKALRVVTSGTTGGTAGGTTAFTSVFTSRTITQANLPNVTFSSDDLSAVITNGTNVVRSNDFMSGGGQGGTNRDALQDGSGETDTLSISAGNINGGVPSGGSGTAMDFAVQYIDVCVGTKN